MDKVIPRSIHYADLKPEVIENTVKLVKFSPQTIISNAQPDTTIKFKMSGNGYLDPYSLFMRIKFQFTDSALSEFSVTSPQQT